MRAGSKLFPSSGPTRAGSAVPDALAAVSLTTVRVLPSSQPAVLLMPSAAAAPSAALTSETAASEAGRMARATLAVHWVVYIANIHPDAPHSEQIAWAAGLFEDEGCITLSGQRSHLASTTPTRGWSTRSG